MTDTPVHRKLEPFAYFPSHASAIGGLGGFDIAPDPNYCFHTPYLEFRPGIVLFRVTLLRAHATEGELAVRVHAYRPNSNLDIALVAGARLPLSDLDGADAEVIIRVSAIPDVQYALYGYFSEPSDLGAGGLSIVAEELGGERVEDFASPETARSLFASVAVDMPNRLMADAAPLFTHPVSQPMTIGQLESTAYTNSWTDIPTDGDPAQRWPQAFALQALATYGSLSGGAGGLLIAEGDLPVANILRAKCGSLKEVFVRASSLDAGERPEGHVNSVFLDEIERINGQFDFLVAITKAGWFKHKADFLAFTTMSLRQLLGGGIAIFLFDYVTATEWPNEIELFDSRFVPTRSDIEQLALRIISHGSDVAQLSFADGGRYQADNITNMPIWTDCSSLI